MKHEELNQVCYATLQFEEPWNTLSEEAIHSMAVQLRWLRRNLEWHLLGNHLLVNAKAHVVQNA